MPNANSTDLPSGLRNRLSKLSIFRREDLVLHFPLRYENETRLGTIAEASIGQTAQIEAVIVAVSVHDRPRRQLVVTVREADSDGGSLLVLRFLTFYPGQKRAFESACESERRVRVFGEIRGGFAGLEMVHPRFCFVNQGDPLPTTLTPVYPTSAGLPQATLSRLIAQALLADDLEELFSEDWLREHALPSFAVAVPLLHAPPATVDTPNLQSRRHPAWRRIKFDELLAQQLALRRVWLERRNRGAPMLAAAGVLSARFERLLPFSPTCAQRRVTAEIVADLAQPYPMQRLLQGDVGSGKTIVAAFAACQAIEAGYQAAFMAPTEILAEQHYLKLRTWLTPLGIEVLWLAGGAGKKVRQEQQQRAATTAQLIVGTHALIEEPIAFARLGLVIVDEQHRFGVVQRLALRRKGENPHHLMMSATPIPRSLAMTYGAGLDVSILDELPPGRSPVRTRLFSEQRRDEITAAIRSVVATGRQAYWVCPLVEEAPKQQLQTAVDTWLRLSQELSELRVGLLHGRLKSDEKATVMAAFVNGQIDVLVATTVIEVGVDVPNASLMVIEHAERFGLAQLHQLRGRIGRGPCDSVCVLLYQQPLSESARARLKIIYELQDGFEIARQDLRLRGPGEFIGSRQSGLPMLRYADLEDDADLVELARATAVEWLQHAPACVARHLRRWLGGRDEFLKA